MKLNWYFSRQFALLVLAPCAGLAQVSSGPTFSEPERHSFKFVVKYSYTVENYTPPVGIDKVETDVLSPKTPEMSLVLLVRAARSGSYPSWLSMWDDSSQRRIEMGRVATKLSDSEFIRQKVNDYRGVSIRSFITRGPYVILRFGRDHDDLVSLAFKQSRSGWVPTTEIDAELAALTAEHFDPPKVVK